MKKKYFTVLSLGFILLGPSACADKKRKTEVGKDAAAQDSTKTVKSREPLLNKDGERVVLRASGTEPFWGLEITDKTIRFTSMVQGFDKFNAPAAGPVRAADANVKMYVAETDPGTIRAQLAQDECANAMSGKVSGYRVKVEIKRGTDKDFTVFEGCGEYITDYRLDDIWVLEEMGGRPAEKDDFHKEAPNMEIHTAENTFTGHAGCNRMNGKIFNEGSLLRFTDIATTRMMCPSGNRENVFLNHLRASTHFEIRDNRLFLNNPDGTALVFKKVD